MTGTYEIDLDLGTAAFAAAWPSHVIAKVDPPGREVPLEGLSMFHGELMANWLEDVLLALQARVGDEQGVQGIVRLGTRRIILTSGWPEGVTSAPVGSLALRQNGFVYVKASGSGNTGWSRINGGGAPVVEQNFFAYAGWGDGATAVPDTGARDVGGSVLITANGAGISANPDLEFTFGAQFDAVPGAVCSMIGGTGADAFVRAAVTNNGIVMTYRALPVAGETYRLAWVVG